MSCPEQPIVKEASRGFRACLELALFACCVFPSLFLACLWQQGNCGYPVFDEAGIYQVALRNFQSMDGWDLTDTLRHLYLDREYHRPTLMPWVAFPSLLITGGQVASAAKIAPIVVFTILVSYVFVFFRHRGGTWSSALAGTWVLTLTTWILHLSHILSSELVFVAFLAAACVHFELSRNLTSRGHSLLTGGWTGLCLCIRPLETLLIVGPCLVIFVACLLHRQQRSLASLKTLASVLCVVLLVIAYEGCSPHRHNGPLWGPTLIAVVCLFPLFRVQAAKPGDGRPCFLEAAILIGLSLALLLLMPFLPAIKDWIIQNSTGSLAEDHFWNAPTDPLFRGTHALWVLARIPFLFFVCHGLIRFFGARGTPKSLSFRGMAVLWLLSLPFLKGFSHNGFMRLCYGEVFLLHLLAIRYLVSPWPTPRVSRLALIPIVLWAAVLGTMNCTRILRIDDPMLTRATAWFGSNDDKSWSGQYVGSPPLHSAVLEFCDWLAQQVDQLSPQDSQQRVRVWWTGAGEKFDRPGILLAAQELYGDERVFGPYTDYGKDYDPSQVSSVMLQHTLEAKANFLLCGGPAVDPLFANRKVLEYIASRDFPYWDGSPQRLHLFRIKAEAPSEPPRDAR